MVFREIMELVVKALNGDHFMISFDESRETIDGLKMRLADEMKVNWKGIQLFIASQEDQTVEVRDRSDLYEGCVLLLYQDSGTVTFHTIIHSHPVLLERQNNPDLAVEVNYCEIAITRCYKTGQVDEFNPFTFYANEDHTFFCLESNVTKLPYHGNRYETYIYSTSYSSFDDMIHSITCKAPSQEVLRRLHVAWYDEPHEFQQHLFRY